MQFDFWSFYHELETLKEYESGDWDRFPEGRKMLFKKEAMSLLKSAVERKDSSALTNVVSILWWDGADSDFTEILLSLLDQNWHTATEDIVGVLELIKDARSVNKLYEVAVNVPDWDEMRGLAKKCMYALAAVNTPEAVDKLKLLAASEDPIMKENAEFHLGYLSKRNV